MVYKKKINELPAIYSLQMKTTAKTVVMLLKNCNYIYVNTSHDIKVLMKVIKTETFNVGFVSK